jgi:NAD(P)-dependent dehydrogenase (short-subunit alcohol dehydrogenase family)
MKENPMPATVDMTGKTCMVTGANSGIGKVTATELARMGAHVVMVSRSRERGEAALAEIRRASSGAPVDLMLADLSSQASIRQLAAEFLAKYDALHVLVNNAGAVYTSRSVTVDGFETTFATNHLNYFLLTHLLLDRIKASAPARIVNVSSRAHARSTLDFDDLQFERGYSAMRCYGQSKLANVLFSYELARRLDGTGVTANCLHPGVVRTGFGKNNSGALGAIVRGGMSVVGMFFIGPEKGAETSVHLATSPDVEGVTGMYFARSKQTPSNSESHDREVARRLWEISEQMCGIAAGSPSPG